MTKLIAFLSLLLVGCSSCVGPSQNDYVGCAAACAHAGVKRVTYSACECNASPGAADGGVR